MNDDLLEGKVNEGWAYSQYLSNKAGLEPLGGSPPAEASIPVRYLKGIGAKRLSNNRLSILRSSKGFVVSSVERCGFEQAPATLRRLD